MIDELRSVDWLQFGEVMAESATLQILVTIICTIFLQIIASVVLSILVRNWLKQRQYIVKTGPVMTREDVEKQEKTLRSVLGTTISVIIWVIAVITMLSIAGVNLATLATGAGLFGIIFGFGAQNMIRDFVAGLFVIIENQYRVGDIISMTVSGKEMAGTVEDITIRITRLRDLDGNLHVVTNGSTQAVTNLSFQYANVNVDIQVPYASDIDTLERIINSVGEELASDEVAGVNIYEPIAFLRVDDFTEFGMKIKALGKVLPAEQWEIAGEFRRRLKRELDKAGIEISYPHVVVRQDALRAKSASKQQK